MQSIAEPYASIVDGDYEVEYKLVLNNVEYSKEKLRSMATQHVLFEENIPMIGCAVSGQIDVTMLKPSATIPRMAEMRPYARVVDKDWEDCGTGTTYLPDQYDAEYRCVVTSGDEEVVSDTVTAALNSATAAITKHPSDFAGAIGTNATFSVTARGNSLSYQWQYYSGSWHNITSAESATTSTLTFEIRDYRLDYVYRCRVRSGNTYLYSNTVRMLAPEDTTALYIRQQPANITYSSNSISTIGVTTNRPLASVQWQRKKKSPWIPQGVYYIDTRSITHSTGGIELLTIHGYDAMMKAEADYPSDTEEYPAYGTYIVSKIAETIGVLEDSRNSALMRPNYKFNLPVGYTMRETLGYIAAVYGGNFIISEEGKLRLVPLASIGNETSLLIDTAGDYITIGGDRILLE